MLLALTAGILSLPALTPLQAAPRFPSTVARTVTLGGGQIDRTLTLPIRANMIGASWLGDAAVALRWHAAGGSWSAWKSLDASDNAPDRRPGVTEGRTARIASDPVWVGTADRVSVRVAGGAREVKLHLIDTLGDAHAPGILGRVVGAVGRLFTSGPAAAPARADVPQASIITRAGWGANESWRRCCPKYAPTVEVAIVHHTDTTNNYNPGDVGGIIRAMYYYHRFQRDFDDIAYQFLIDRFGRIFEGRYGGIDKPVIGAHTEGMNSRTAGIALIGTFSTVAPPAAQLLALENLLAWKLDVHHIPAIGLVPMTSGGSAKLKKGQVVSMNRIAGHRDAQSTDCPGTKLYNLLPAIRRATEGIAPPKFYLNATPQTLRPDGDGVLDAVRMRVWFSSTMTWKIAFSDASGTAKREALGAGTYADVTWDGKDAVTGAYGATGSGTITVTATDAGGKAARPAVVPINYVMTHPAGTYLDAGGTRVWVDANGARSVPTDAVAASWFRSTEAVATTQMELARYTASAPLGFREGTILKTPDGAFHFVAGGLRRDFATAQLYAALGYTDASAISAPQEEVDAIPPGPVIDNPAVHPDGAVVIDANKVSWVISGGARHKVASLVIRRSTYRDAEVAPATAGDVALPEGSAVSLRDGSLVKTPDGWTWLIFGGQRRVFRDDLSFGAFGFRTAAVQSASWSDLAGLTYGGVIA